MRAGLVLRIRARRRIALRAAAGGAGWLSAAVAATLLAVAVPSAEAYNYGYDLNPTADDQWWSRGVAHNYSYLSGYNDSGSVAECIKLTRTTDGTNYGPVVCTAGSGVANRHYAGDTGTLSWGKNDSPSNGCCWAIHMYEEW